MASLIMYNETATSVEASKSKGVIYSIKLIKNDGTADLYVGLNKSTSNTENDYILLQAGEYMEDLQIAPLTTLYFKSASGSVPFRVYGTGA